MAKYYPIEMVVDYDNCNQMIPKVIIWNGVRQYPIERIIHICQPEDLITRYTMKVAGRQRCFYFNGLEWRISNPI